jgi:hypothetical protein
MSTTILDRSLADLQQQPTKRGQSASLAAIMQILGHSRLSTTLKYGQPTDDDLRAALEEAGRIR